jgi:hypothetical protein
MKKKNWVNREIELRDVEEHFEHLYCEEIDRDSNNSLED